MQEICVALFLYLVPINYSSLKSALGLGFYLQIYETV